METSRLIKSLFGCLLLLAAACGESHDLEPEDFEDTPDSGSNDAGSGAPASRADSGAGGLLGGLLDPNVLGGLLGNLGGGGNGTPDAGRPTNNTPRDAGAEPARDAATVNPACERYPQLPFCPRDGGVQDAGRDAAVGDAGHDAGHDAGAADAGDASADAADGASHDAS